MSEIIERPSSWDVIAAFIGPNGVPFTRWLVIAQAAMDRVGMHRLQPVQVLDALVDAYARAADDGLLAVAGSLEATLKHMVAADARLMARNAVDGFTRRLPLSEVSPAAGESFAWT